MSVPVALAAERPAAAVIEVAGATKSFSARRREPVTILSDLDLVVPRGRTVAVMGRSGSGKSTLLRALGMFQPFDSGIHRVLGADVSALSDRAASQLRAGSIGFVFQDFRLLGNLTAVENVEYAAALAGIARRERRERARTVLEDVGLDARMHAKPRLLSGGEQQRVAIARALVKGPELILADEPTGALDAHTAEGVLDLLLATARNARTAVVLVTHDAAVAARCEQRLDLLDGRLHAEGVPV